MTNFKMTKRYFFITILLLSSYAYGGPGDGWKRHELQLDESVWKISFERPQGWLMEERGVLNEPAMLFGTRIFTFAKNKKCLIDRFSSCDGSYFIVRVLSSHEQGKSLVPPSVEIKGEKTVHLSGAKGNIAIRGEGRFSFQTPDGNSNIAINGTGSVFERVVRTVRIGK